MKFGKHDSCYISRYFDWNYANMWFKSNAIGYILTMQWRIQSAVTVSVNGQEPRCHHRAKVKSAYYFQHVLGDGLLPDIRTRSQRYAWTLQRRTARSHIPLRTSWHIPVTWVRHVHWASKQVTSNNSCINHSITLFSGALQQVMYSRWRLTSVEELQHVIKFSQWFIDRIISAWHRRLKCVFSNKEEQTKANWTLTVNEAVKIAVYCHSSVCLKLSNITVTRDIKHSH